MNKHIDEMTPQEVFDYGSKHLLNQGKRSVRSNCEPDCEYFGPNGLKCAVGAFIPDDEYVPEIEGKAFQDLDQYLDWKIFEYTNDDDEQEKNELKYRILQDFQTIHDESEPEYWHLYLKELAEDEGLNAKVLE